jgi:hypothetical protein
MVVECLKPILSRDPGVPAMAFPTSVALIPAVEQPFRLVN